MFLLYLFIMVYFRVIIYRKAKHHIEMIDSNLNMPEWVRVMYEHFDKMTKEQQKAFVKELTERAERAEVGVCVLYST
jgi:hypothetical protein